MQFPLWSACLAKTTSPVDEAQLPTLLPPPGTSPAPGMLVKIKHSHKRGNLPDSLFSCSSPRPVRRTMRMGKKEKELHQVQYQRTQFVKVISGDVSRCLGQNPLLATLYSHRDLFSRISQPTRLAAMLGEHEAASLSLLGVLTSVEVPYRDPRRFPSIVSEPFVHDSPDSGCVKLLTLFTVCVNAVVCNLSGFLE